MAGVFVLLAVVGRLGIGTPPECFESGFAPKSSINSCSFSSRFDFQTMTTESAPPVVK